jgi:lipopolysaccharide export system protein LptC
MSFWDKYQLYVYVSIAAFLSWGLLQINQRRAETVEIAQNSPDFISNNYYKKQMGVDGLPQSELVAKKMLHDKVDGSSHFQEPIMTLFHSGQSPWVIKAEQGVMEKDGDHLQLLGNSLISRDAYQNKAALTIKTADLKVNLATHFAQTDAWAEITSSPHKTSGTGMEVTFVSPIHLKLLSKVKGRYEIN